MSFIHPISGYCLILCCVPGDKMANGEDHRRDRSDLAGGRRLGWGQGGLQSWVGAMEGWRCPCLWAGIAPQAWKWRHGWVLRGRGRGWHRIALEWSLCHIRGSDLIPRQQGTREGPGGWKRCTCIWTEAVILLARPRVNSEGKVEGSVGRKTMAHGYSLPSMCSCQLRLNMEKQHVKPWLWSWTHVSLQLKPCPLTGLAYCLHLQIRCLSLGTHQSCHED